MFALVSLALFLGADEAAAKPALDTCPVPLAQVISGAFDDFEVHYSELGLVGAAPLLGREVLDPSAEIVSTFSDFDGSAQVASAPQRIARIHHTR